MPADTGLFIAFEGGEGAGKSTQVARLAATLSERGLDVVCTREPGGTAAAEAIREVLLRPADPVMAPRCEVLLFAAARADHVAKVIGPAIGRGAVVLCDRFIDSSVAYQGHARGEDVGVVTDISLWAVEGLLPDLTVVLDIEPHRGLARARDGNRMEAESLRFHQAVREGLLGLAAADPDRYLVVDAEQDQAVVARQILAAVDLRLAVAQ